MPSARNIGWGRFRVRPLGKKGWAVMRRGDIEIPPSGLVNTALAAQIAGVKPGTIRQWKNRGHLQVATEADGSEFRDPAGRPLFHYLDVIEVEYQLRERARRPDLRYA